MVDLKNLEEAITDLQVRLITAKDRRSELKETAEDWDINPLLLERKFRERNGVSLEEYQPVDKELNQLRISHLGIEGDDIRFTIGQRSMDVALPGEDPDWRYISGMLIRQQSGAQIVLRTVTEQKVIAIPLGIKTSTTIPIESAFGTLEELKARVRAAPPSLIEPAEFKEWVARQSGR